MSREEKLFPFNLHEVDLGCGSWFGKAILSHYTSKHELDPLSVEQAVILEGKIRAQKEDDLYGVIVTPDDLTDAIIIGFNAHGEVEGQALGNSVIPIYKGLRAAQTRLGPFHLTAFQLAPFSDMPQDGVDILGAPSYDRTQEARDLLPFLWDLDQ